VQDDHTSITGSRKRAGFLLRQGESLSVFRLPLGMTDKGAVCEFADPAMIREVVTVYQLDVELYATPANEIGGGVVYWFREDCMQGRRFGPGWLRLSKWLLDHPVVEEEVVSRIAAE